jgi:glutathione S-transferase
MSQFPAITLRYFDCRGRAQYFRYYFRQRNIAFIDSRISLKDGFSAWMEVKADHRQTGPFQKLPVLHWGEQQIAEGAVIHQWLHKQSGDEAKLSTEDNLRHSMLSSSLASEVMTTIALLLWQEIMHPKSDLIETARTMLKRLHDHMRLIDTALHDWQWLAGLQKRPVMLTDCLLWEELSVLQTVFGAAFTLSEFPTLAALWQQCPGRAQFQQLLDAHPSQLTGRPQEADVIARIQQALAP